MIYFHSDAGVSHVCSEEETYNGYRIPKGAVIMPNAWYENNPSDDHGLFELEIIGQWVAIRATTRTLPYSTPNVSSKTTRNRTRMDLLLALVEGMYIVRHSLPTY